MKKGKFNELRSISYQLRRKTLDMCIKGKTGHVTSSFSCAEILTVLYFGGILKYDSKNPLSDKRDRFVLSKGQASPILYNVLAKAGFFPEGWIKSFAKQKGHFGVHLQNNVPGVEFTTGSLGHGLGYGAGTALAGRINKRKYHTFVLLGDAELYEGSNWEVAMFVAHHKLNNLTGIVDRNGLGVLGFTEEIVAIDPLPQKFGAFGWETKEINGNSIEEVYDSLEYAKIRGKTSGSEKPLMIIANTTKGKGIPSWENVALKHGVAPKGEEAKKLCKELEECFFREER